MSYLQLVEFDSIHPVEEFRRALDDWLAVTREKHTVQTAIVAADTDRPNHYWELVEFPSEEEAARSHELPETKAAYERWIALVDGEPTFNNLHVAASR